MSTETKTRPNQNPILDAARDSWDSYDGLSCAVELAFACATGLWLAGEYVPSDWAFSPGAFRCAVDERADYMAEEFYFIGEEVWSALESGDADVVREAGRAAIMLIDYAKSIGQEL